jgi:hypothetical protein
VKVLHESALTVPIPEQEQQIEPWSVDGHHLAFDYLAISKKTWTHFWVIVDARKWNTQLRKTSSYQRPDCPERKREPHKCTMLSCVKTPHLVSRELRTCQILCLLFCVRRENFSQSPYRSVSDPTNLRSWGC